MSGEKKDFYGKEVTDAIKKACDSFNVSQEQLDIEVLETGSTGIFGLIRKKAKIRVSLKAEEEPVEVIAEQPPATEPQESVQKEDVMETVQPEPESTPEPEPTPEPESTPQPKPTPQRESVSAVQPKAEEPEDDEDEDVAASSDEVDVSQESIDLVQREVAKLIELMGYPSSVDVVAKGLSIRCNIGDEHEQALAGPEGKTLDSIQYLVRKMVARQCTERLRISVNVGNFREKRLEELKERAIELAKKVRESGKTHVLPALNPSERREVHIVLQEDKEVRSRSVGDGLFKKILIYKPGKGNRGGRRKGGPRGRKGKYNKSS